MNSVTVIYLPGGGILPTLPSVSAFQDSCKRKGIDMFVCDTYWKDSDRVIEQVTSFITNVVANRIVLCGHSLGGAIALKLSSLPRVVGLLLLSPSTRYSYKPSKMFRFMITMAYSLFTHAEMYELMGHIRLQSPTQDFWNMLRDQNFHSIRIPVFVSIGTQDGFVKVRHMRHLCNRLPSAQLDIVKASSHYLIAAQHKYDTWIHFLSSV